MGWLVVCRLDISVISRWCGFGGTLLDENLASKFIGTPLPADNIRLVVAAGEVLA